jgi:hypothetical protein
MVCSYYALATKSTSCMEDIRSSTQVWRYRCRSANRQPCQLQSALRTFNKPPLIITFIRSTS